LPPMGDRNALLKYVIHMFELRGRENPKYPVRAPSSYLLSPMRF
jgi:hypothetical protein